MSARGWAWLRHAFLPASVVILVLGGSLVPLPAYIELPGSATGIPACVRIGSRPEASVNGDFLLTTVAQREATIFGVLLAGVLDNQIVVSRRDLLEGVRRDEYLREQRRVFIDSTQRAVIVALEAAGLPVDVRGSGVDVVDVIDDTPAEGVLRAGDVIMGVDGEPVSTDVELVEAIDGDAPLMLRLQRGGEVTTETVRPEMREVDGERRAVIGVRIVTHEPEVVLPFDVDVSSGEVGGPSAGLMVALAVFDLVDETDVADGRRIAGTGTLALDGSVGPISNIELKVPTAIRVGADVFVAPAAQADAARAAVPAGSDLRVLGVDTFDDARTALAGTGVPRPTEAVDHPCMFPARRSRSAGVGA